MDRETVVDSLYEAAMLPERLPAALESLAELAGAKGGLLFLNGQYGASAVLTESLFSAWEAQEAGGWAAVNPRPGRLIASQRKGFVSCLDVFTREELETHPFYRHHLRNAGLGWAAGAMVELPTGEIAVVSLEKAFAAGPFSAKEMGLLNGLRADLVRALRLATLRGISNTTSTVSALEEMRLPAAALDFQGRLVAANRLFTRLIPSVFTDLPSRLRLADADANAALTASLLRSDDRATIAVPARWPDPPMLLHVIPLRGDGRDMLAGVTTLLVVDSPMRRDVLDEAAVAHLLRATPAEARVARALVLAGGDYRKAASQLDLSVETVRSHAKSIYAKSGISGAMELITLLKALGGPAT